MSFTLIALIVFLFPIFKSINCKTLSHLLYFKDCSPPATFANPDICLELSIYIYAVYRASSGYASSPAHSADGAATEQADYKRKQASSHRENKWCEILCEFFVLPLLVVVVAFLAVIWFYVLQILKCFHGGCGLVNKQQLSPISAGQRLLPENEKKRRKRK